MPEHDELFAVRGYMKSGTNWVGNLLNLHPDISCVGEFHWERVLQPFADNIARLEATARFPGLRPAARSQMQTCVREIVRSANRPNVLRFGDRTPGRIDLHWFPPARYIDVVRDGRDVLVSRAFHLFRHPRSTRLFDDDPHLRENLERFQADPFCFTHEPERLLTSELFVRQTARVWSQTVQHNQQMAEQSLAGRIHRVYFEQLHADTEQQRHQLYAFLEVDTKRAEPIDSRTRAGFAQERPDQFYRKGAVGDWRKYFNDRVEVWFHEEAGETLAAMGYT